MYVGELLKTQFFFNQTELNYDNIVSSLFVLFWNVLQLCPYELQLALNFTNALMSVYSMP